MKLRNLLSILFVFFTLPIFAQERLITCSSEQNPNDRSISILAESKAYGQYTVKLVFTSLSGYSANVNSDVALVIVNRGHSPIAKLTFDKSANLHSFNYRYQYFPGIPIRRMPDTSFAYLLPVSEGNSLRMYNTKSITERIGKAADGFSGVGFIYKLGDTICAARGGTVYECSDEMKEGEKMKEVYNSQRNKIFIEHKDGTLSRYSIVAPIKLLVQQGDEVIPGQPMAVLDKQSAKYDVLFSVEYLDDKKASINTERNPQPVGFSPYSYLPAAFYVDDIKRTSPLEPFREYISSHPKEIIGAEMSKKDKKKLGL